MTEHLWGGFVYFVGAILILSVIALVRELFKWIGRRWL